MASSSSFALRASIREAAVACGAAVALAAGALPGQAFGADEVKAEPKPAAVDVKLGGRFQLEYAAPIDDDELNLGNGGPYFRRMRLNVTGRVLGWDYKFENEFADTNQPSFRDAWIAHDLGPGQLTLGQFKAQRGMEELTSAYELTMLERPVTAANGIFSGRQFGIGAMYKLHGGGWTGALAVQSLGQIDDGVKQPTESTGTTARVTWAPVRADRSVVHLGLSASFEKQEDDLDLNADSTGDPALRTRMRIPSGRRGTQFTLAQAGEGDTANHVGLELAAVMGSFYVQSELANASYENATTNGGEDDDVLAYHVAASWIVTGESKPYDDHRGTFKSPKVAADDSAVELTARYEAAAADEVENDGNTATVGVNWYWSQTLRFMANYSVGEIDTGGTTREASLLTVRAQVVF